MLEYFIECGSLCGVNDTEMSSTTRTASYEDEWWSASDDAKLEAALLDNYVDPSPSQPNAIIANLDRFYEVVDRSLEWSSKKPYLLNLFAGWLEGNDVASQNSLIKNQKKKWWTMTQSPDIIQRELSDALFGAIAITIHASHQSNWGLVEIRKPTFPLTILLQNGANPNALSGGSNEGGTGLHWLADMVPHEEEDSDELRERQVLLAQILLDHGADVNARMGDQLDRCTPLIKACSSRAGVNLDFIDLLLDNGADVNAVTKQGWTFIMYSLPLNLTGTWHIFLKAKDKINAPLFVKEIAEALTEERLEYFKKKHELQQKNMDDMVYILAELQENLLNDSSEEEDSSEDEEEAIVEKLWGLVAAI